MTTDTVRGFSLIERAGALAAPREIILFIKMAQCWGLHRVMPMEATRWHGASMSILSRSAEHLAARVRWTGPAIVCDVLTVTLC